jgi:hypothetical protein
MMRTLMDGSVRLRMRQMVLNSSHNRLAAFLSWSTIVYLIVLFRTWKIALILISLAQS